MLKQDKKMIRFLNIFGFTDFKSKFWKIFGLLLIQQIIVATSSLWLTEFTFSLQQNEISWTYISLFILSLVLPYLPGAFSLFALKNWEFDSISLLWNYYFLDWKNRPDLWNSKDEHESQKSLVHKEAPLLVHETSRFSYEFLSTGLNLSLNIIVLTSILDFKILVSFVMSALILFLAALKTKNRNQSAALLYENKKSMVSKWLLSLWDNLVLGNKDNFFFWKSEFENKRKSFLGATQDYAFAQEMISTFISMIGFIPPVLLIIYYCFERAENPQQLVPFVTLFPRLFILLNTTTSFVFFLRNSFGFKARWWQILEKMTPPEPNNLEQRIQFHKIKTNLSETSFSNYNEFISTTLTTKGRITIRGENGAGKSSLLLWLKSTLGERAFYLPHENHLEFENPIKNQSTGQKIKIQLDEIQRRCPAEIILLDEWDANLDQSNIEVISAQIDQLALNKTVFEVRHRL